MQFFMLLSSYSLLLLWTGSLWLKGPSALGVLLILVTALIAGLIWRHSQKQQQQSILVLKALANQDPSLALRDQPRLQNLLTEVQQQLSESRCQAEAKAQYLQTLLSQLDIAVLEFADDGKLLQANPAAQRLLSVAQWQHLQQGQFAQANLQQLELILQHTNSHYQGQLQWQQLGYADRLALSIVCTRIAGQVRKLVTLQSIDQALLQQEVQAYQKMTQVLTHEIANSVTPMASLAQSCQHILPAAGEVINPELHADLSDGLATILRRGQHLTAFISSFNQLSQQVQPRLQQIDLVSVINSCLVLQRDALQRQAIEVQLMMPSQVKLWLDEALIEQVIINLLQNAIDAMLEVEQKQLTINLQHNSQQLWQLDIIDSGPGISEQVAQQIFIPFFTTKQKGSGIGLSLSRALLHAQDAQLQYVANDKLSSASSKLPKATLGSCFRIIFKP